MRTSSLFLACLLTMAGCCAHRRQVGPSWPLPSLPPEKPYVLALASFQVKTPGAETKAQVLEPATRVGYDAVSAEP